MPASSSSQYIPHLPAEFLEKIISGSMMIGIKSQVFSAHFQKSRLEILSCKSRVGPDVVLCLETFQGSTKHDYMEKMKRTLLHFAADLGDPPMACEMIRLGANLNLADARGCTPLILALQSLKNPNPAIPRSLYASRRHTYIARTLIEQHADINKSDATSTPLTLACEARAWDLIELLLAHGSNITPPNTKPAIDYLISAADKARFSALLSSKSTSRPPRLCPCFSGKTLEECHKKSEKPYPPYLICRCGSSKLFSQCCIRRERMCVMERWDPKESWIQTTFRVWHAQDFAEQGLLRIADGKPYVQYVYPKGGYDTYIVENPLPYTLAKDINACTDKIKTSIAEQSQRGLLQIDPAYLYALQHVDFSPRPLGRQWSKHDCKERQDLWNTAVNEYIAMRTDPRTKIEIERAAKIGITLGALYKTCEGVGCDNMEGREVKSLLTCGQCKIAYYCSRECQKSSWKAHKKVCGSYDQTEQELPSQTSIYESFKFPTIANIVANMLADEMGQ